MSNATDSEDRLEHILDQVRELKAKYDERTEVTGEKFNVFSILDRERYEVTTHSAIIAELLNPQGSHSQKELFLELFLERLKPAVGVSNERTGFKVRTEVFVFVPEKKEKGYLDIVIENDDAYIVIENKTDTEDAEGQLKKYCEHIEKIEKKTKVLLYLTLEGEGPKKLTLCGRGPVYQIEKFPLLPLMCLSYKKFIDDWLDACIKEVALIPQIRETLHQYQMTVRKLTGQLPPEIEDKLNGLDKKSKDGILKDLQHELQCEFWRELKKRLIEEQLADQNSKFQLYESDMSKDEEILDDAELKESIRRCHPSLGLTFSIQNSSIDDEHEIAFRVYYERPHGKTKLSSFNYGFVFCRKRNTEKDTLQRDRITQQHKDKDAIKRYMRLEHPKDKKPSHGQDGWLSWDYFYYKPRNFITESRETLIRKLISEINSALSKARQ